MDVERLNEAFHNFTTASKSLESSYEVLRERVRYLTTELEKKNRQLNDALADAESSKDYLNAILYNLEDAIIVIDPADRVTMINKAAKELLGLDSTGVTGRKFADLDFSITEDGSGTSLSAGDKKYNIIFSRSAVADSDGSLRGSVILIKDITRLRDLEIQNERNQRLIAMGEMAVTLVHEIRNPLCSIELFSGMLEKELADNDHKKLAGGISAGIGNLNNILTNMLFFAKPHKAAMSRIRLDSVISDSLAMLMPLMESKRVILEQSVHDYRISGDAEILKQLFMNIIINAIQSMPEGGIVNITMRKDGASVVADVQDNGEGIKRRYIEKIFDPFFSTKDKGTGLGLALATASIIMLALGLVPGLPHIPFFILSAASGGIAFVLSRPEVEEREEEKEEAETVDEPAIETFIEIEPLTFEIGYGLVPFVESGKAELLGKIKSMRRQLASELGFVVPVIHIKDNLQLRPHEYSFLIRGIEVGKGEVMVGHYLAVAPGKAEKIDGIPTKEPAFGLPAFWVTGNEVENAHTKGYMVVDVASVITTHLTEMVKSHSWELLTRTEVQGLLDNVSKNYPKIVEELIPSHLTLGGVQRVLQNLLKERVQINDLVTILDTLLEYSPSTKDTEILTEYVRHALSRLITKQHMTQDGNIHVMTLDPKFESAVATAMEAGGVISPEVVNKLIRAIETAVSDGSSRGIQPIILCSTHVRRFLRKVTERFLPSIPVLSTSEIVPSVKLYTTGVLRYED